MQPAYLTTSSNRQVSRNKADEPILLSTNRLKFFPERERLKLTIPAGFARPPHPDHPHRNARILPSPLLLSTLLSLFLAPTTLFFTLLFTLTAVRISQPRSSYIRSL